MDRGGDRKIKDEKQLWSGLKDEEWPLVLAQLRRDAWALPAGRRQRFIDSAAFDFNVALLEDSLRSSYDSLQQPGRLPEVTLKKFPNDRNPFGENNSWFRAHAAASVQQPYSPPLEEEGGTPPAWGEGTY
ncbi:hypothetical protein EYF80_011739 [Liparis tanakae]|uniref:Uncharacterized protein n=1 Tax=Liparis tanakae TaxID=230148 RepID=A0A4Z2IJD0_9TELE|nr:hypothetical protein EYF80_011739 [Liparis tanakae]